MPSFRFEFAAPAVFVFIALAGGIIAAAWYYRSTVPVVSQRTRLLLTVLRAASFSCLLLLLTQPLLRLFSTSTEPPSLAVLLDNSTSMRITDGTGNRTEALRKILSSGVLKSVERRAAVRYYTFGLSLKPFTGSDTLTLNEEATNFSVALQSLAREKEAHHIDAALLVTDGAPTLGRNPLYDAEAVGLPMYTIGVGDTSEPRDLLITRVAANELVYSDLETPVDITLKSSGFGGERVQVRLLHGSAELARNTVVLSPGIREYSVSLNYVPRGEGTVRYSVQVDVLPDELTAVNNRSVFAVRILKTKLRLLVVAGSPGPDIALLGQTLREEKNFDVRTFTQRLSSGYYEGSLGKNVLDSADCILFIGFPTTGTSAASFQPIVDAVTTRNMPLFFLAGTKVDYEKLRQLGNIVPFSVDVFAPIEQYVSAQLVEAEKLNPLVTFDRVDGAEIWKHLPPLLRTLVLFKARPESRTLIMARGDNTQATDPLVLIRSIGKQKSLSVTAYGLWRWRLLVQGDPQTEGFLATFLSGAIKWLTSPEDSRPVRVEPTKELFVRGEPVEFTGQVYDQKLSPVDDARVTVTLERRDGSTATRLRSLGNGRYEGKLEGLAEGEYRFTATAEAGGRTIGGDAGTFSIGGVSLEMQDTRANFALLRLLASRTGGRFLQPSGIDALDSLLAGEPWFVAQEIRSTKDYELWNWQYLLAAIVFLLATEWVVRRRAGML